MMSNNQKTQATAYGPLSMRRYGSFAGKTQASVGADVRVTFRGGGRQLTYRGGGRTDTKTGGGRS